MRSRNRDAGPRAHLDVLRARGTEVRAPARTFTAPVGATDVPEALGRAGYTLVTVKNDSPLEVAPATRTLAEAGSVILPLLNRVEVVDHLVGHGVPAIGCSAGSPRSAPPASGRVSSSAVARSSGWSWARWSAGLRNGPSESPRRSGCRRGGRGLGGHHSTWPRSPVPWAIRLTAPPLPPHHATWRQAPDRIFKRISPCSAVIRPEAIRSSTSSTQ